MEIIKQLEINGVRFEAVIKSKTLETHSRMQSLSEDEIDNIKLALNNILQVIADRI